ncbi:MAG: EAL domain-containing protein [Colwellia sp.]|nr:EAL domain-containing protein [Colwellia sp.]
MRKFFYSPLVRMSFGLTMLTVSMLLIADILGLIPSTRHAELQSRKAVAESLAIQLSAEVMLKRLQNIDQILNSMVERNKTISSIAVRTTNNKLLANVGNHTQYWTLSSEDKSTATQVQVPLFNGKVRWGSVEIVFTKLANGSGVLSIQSSLLGIILFITIVGFLAYLLFLKRALRELNPDAVIPERVSKALDTLTEGLLILDHKGYVVFANSAFSLKMCMKPEKLLGKDIAKFDWKIHDTENGLQQPWINVLAGKVLSGSSTMKLTNALGKVFILTVQASPIVGNEDKVRGVLITFDDITEIEAKNDELHRTLLSLEKSKNEVSKQNQTLQILAYSDPLTGILNRRSLTEGMNTLFDEAKEENTEFSCIMVDIDHFKSVNDRFGHAIGDEVIKLVTQILTEHTRPIDLVGRLGGEEFIAVLPNTPTKEAIKIGNRMRLAIENADTNQFIRGLQVTSSFGVASLKDGAQTALELLDWADKGLYEAKETGRNRVISWSNTIKEDEINGKLTSAQDEQVVSCDISQPADTEVNTVAIGTDNNQNDELVPLPTPSTEPDELISEENHTQNIRPMGNDSSKTLYSALLLDRIEQGIKRTYRDNTQIAILVVDIDALQRVNDIQGLVVGEKLANIIIAKLKQTLRPTDTVAIREEDNLLFTVSRHGSNEIIILLTDLEQPEIITNIMHRIFSAVEEPVEVESNEIYLNANIGISVFPMDGEDSETLIKNASSAMCLAKLDQVKNGFRFYADNVNQLAMQKILMEAELYRAVERDELLLHYQPKMNLVTGDMLGMEALVRWQHPRLGFIPPNDFIPLTEQIGLIDNVSFWVIRAACKQILFWQNSGHGIINIAVNLSPINFSNPNFGTQLITLVEEFGIPASAIELEITETAVIHNMDVMVSIMEELYNAGFRITLDDFGTGFSSLSYLKRLPINKVKIDRSFILDFLKKPSDAAIVSAIIAMSHSLGAQVVAEGVETKEQLRFLQDLNCDEIQGYLISKPMPSEDIIDLLENTLKIKKMILDSSVNIGKTHHQGSGPASRMIGILNDFPAKKVS